MTKDAAFRLALATLAYLARCRDSEHMRTIAENCLREIEPQPDPARLKGPT